MPARVGVILSGCGVRDGSEIHEAVSILIALDKRGATIVCCAPNIPQSETINHVTGRSESHNRNVLEESARIARGKVRDLATVKASDLDALVFPGGYGAAKNLSDFATRGAKCHVNPEVARILKEMHAQKKPIGLACISPVVAAGVFGAMGLHPTLTIGTDPETAQAINAMGAQHKETDPTGVVVDHANKLVTTPCYMNDVTPWVVYQGADKMVDEVLKMTA